jgi:hypothetical protein
MNSRAASDTGAIALDHALQVLDKDGVRFNDALAMSLKELGDLTRVTVGLPSRT